MRSITLLATFSLIIYFLTIRFCESASVVSCRICRGEKECDKEPANYCYFGETRDICGYRACKSGPNQNCGGPNSVRGICGDGMQCSKLSSRCIGCYIEDPASTAICADD